MAASAAPAPQPPVSPGPFAPTQPSPSHQSYWLWVMCLTGVDYFSTLGYQPSIAYKATALLTPLATLVLVIVTLFGALPVYAHVAAESPHGQGSIAMLERLVRAWGWRWSGKILVLVLLGFAATDFVITKTLSAADAAEHLLHNPFWERASASIDHHVDNPWLPNAMRSQVVVTIVFLVFLGAFFMRGFREVIGLAVGIVAVYLFLNLIIIAAGLIYLGSHPDIWQHWFDRITAGDWGKLEFVPLAGSDGLTMILVCLLLFPKLALGLSGFETGVAVMPLVKGKPDDDPQRPRGRIMNARKLLFTAALIMSVYLIGSAVVTTMLIPAEDLKVVEDAQGRLIPEESGIAANRALAYLAHEQGPHHLSPLFGAVFGTIYDISTIVILWFAGASAMAGLLNLVPQYLPRYGMAPEWARAVKPLVCLFVAVNLFVTWWFNADVTSQSGAYATGVLVLISSASVATLIDYWGKRPRSWLRTLPWLATVAFFAIVTAAFLYTTVAIVIEKPDGIKIASFFIATVMLLSMVSRTMRSTELRVTGFDFVDAQSRFLWDSMKHLEFPVLVPHRPGSRDLPAKEESIRKDHHLTSDIPIVFIEAEIGDPSEFNQRPLMEVTQEEGRFILRVRRCASISHVIAALALELSKVGKPPEIHFGWSDESTMTANIGFVLFGEGNVPWMVRELIIKAEPDPSRHPRIVIG